MSAYWADFVLWVDSIPAVIWSGAIGASLALIGVFFADRSNTKRLTLQLAHDATQRERDRLSALRKEVYLQAPREAVKAIQYLGNLASRDLATLGDDEGISGYIAASAQIGVISDLPTVEAIGRFGNVIALEFITAMHELRSVQDTRVDIRVKDERLQLVFEEIRRIQAEQQAIGESGTHDPQRHKALCYWRDARIEESQRLMTELDALRVRQQQLLLEYQKGAFERMPTISQHGISVMREIRKEIGLAHELDEYEAKMNYLATDLRAKIIWLLEELTKEMEAEFTAPTSLPSPELAQVD